MLQGFDVDVAHEIARDLLGDPGKVDFRLLRPEERIPALLDETVDLVVQAMTISCPRAEQIAFSAGAPPTGR